MKFIDLENHFYDKYFLDVLEQRSKPPYYRKATDTLSWTDDMHVPQGKMLEALLEVGEGRIAIMDRLGITTAVLSCSPGVEELDAAESIPLCRVTNDAMYELSKKFPGRYLGSAVLPVKDVSAACAELERCVKELGFVAWQSHSNYGDTYPDEEQYVPLFKKAAELGVYVYLHPQIPHDIRLGDLGFTILGAGLGFTVDTMITITRMVVSGLFDEIPDLKVILGHFGEALPFLLDRIDGRLRYLPNPKTKNKQDYSYYFHNNIWVTTSGNMSKEAFACTQAVLGIDRILFGSDHPYESLDEMVEFVKEIPLTESERQKLYYKNAEDLGIKL